MIQLQHTRPRYVENVFGGAIAKAADISRVEYSSEGFRTRIGDILNFDKEIKRDECTGPSVRGHRRQRVVKCRSEKIKEKSNRIFQRPIILVSISHNKKQLAPSFFFLALRRTV